MGRTKRVGGRRWRRLRAYVLARDGYVCRMVEGCGERATTADHVVPLVMGGAELDPDNVRAACARHNYSAGALLSTRRDLGTASREWLA